MLKKLLWLCVLMFFILSGCNDIMYEPLLPPPPALLAPITAMEEVIPEPELAVTPLTPRNDGTLHLSMRVPSTLNPLLNEDATVARVLQLMFEPLITFDEELRPIPHLAHLEFAWSGDSVVLTIKENAFWSDGYPVTAEDLVFSIQTLQRAPQEVIYKQNVANFTSVTALNERSVRVTFNTIMGGAAYLFNFPIIPSHYFAHNPMSTSPPSNGPFRFGSYIPAETLTLVRNDNTFRLLPYIDEIQVLITPNNLTDIHAFDRGLVDIFLAEVPEWARHHSVKPVQSAQHPAMYFEFVGFNFNQPLPAMLQFRQAIAHTLEVETIISDIFLAHATPTKSPVHPSSWLYNQDLPAHVYNMEIAQQLAEQALRVADREDIWPRNGEGEKRPVQVMVNESNHEGVHIARTVVRQMNTIGLLAELVAMPAADYLWHLQNGYFDMFVGGYNLSIKPNLRFAFHSESPDNILAYGNYELDRLLEAAAAAGSDSQFYRAVNDVQIYIARQLPVISLAFRHSAVIADRSIGGDLRPGISNVFANIEDWFILQE